MPPSVWNPCATVSATTRSKAPVAASYSSTARLSWLATRTPPDAPAGAGSEAISSSIGRVRTAASLRRLSYRARAGVRVSRSSPPRPSRCGTLLRRNLGGERLEEHVEVPAHRDEAVQEHLARRRLRRLGVVGVGGIELLDQLRSEGLVRPVERSARRGRPPPEAGCLRPRSRTRRAPAGAASPYRVPYEGAAPLFGGGANGVFALAGWGSILTGRPRHGMVSAVFCYRQEM